MFFHLNMVVRSMTHARNLEKEAGVPQKLKMETSFLNNGGIVIKIALKQKMSILLTLGSLLKHEN